MTIQLTYYFTDFPCRKVQCPIAYHNLETPETLKEFVVSELHTNIVAKLVKVTFKINPPVNLCWESTGKLLFNEENY